MTQRLTSADGLSAGIAIPAYDRSRLKTGIVHFGPGMFHRAHQAWYTDATLAAGNDSWGIEGAELRETDIDARLNPQNGLYTLLVRDGDGTKAQIVGSVLAAHIAPRDPERVLARLADPLVRIFSLTVTEKAYGLDPATGGLDDSHPDIAADLVDPEKPRGVVGHIVEGLARRRAAGNNPVTVLSCDNLADNGKLLRRAVLAFAERRDPVLRRWIENNVPFPCTMVDRITPAATDRTLADARAIVGREDLAAVETEPFRQWVIEDTFADGRPDWDIAGAIFAADVAPYEKMKLRMLNGSHSLLSYLGFLSGCEFVRDAMAVPALAALVRAHMAAVAGMLDPVPGISLADYADTLCVRFTNKAIAHATYQIAMDGTQKLPQRLLEPALETLKEGRGAETFAIAVAAWMRYVLGEDDKGIPYDLRDPRSQEIAALLRDVPRSGKDIAQRLFGLPGLFPASLLAHSRWKTTVVDTLDLMISRGVRAALDSFAAREPA